MNKPLLCLFLSLCFVSLQQLFSQVPAVDDLSCSLPCVDKNFNVKVVMTIDSVNRSPLRTEQEVNELLVKASKYFKPICVSMSSCDYQVIPNNYTYSEIYEVDRREEMRIVYSYPRRVTIFFVKKVVSDGCGFSETGGLMTKKDAQIFVALDCGDAPELQIAHHLGRLLGLLPTNFDNALELVDGSNCATAGDKICDTPADPYGMTRDSLTNAWILNERLKMDDYVRGCEFLWEVQDDNGEFFSPKTNNIMSPYYCKCSFTPTQFIRMAENIKSATNLMY